MSKSQQTITLDIPTVNAKLKNVFKNDTHADVRIIYNKSAVFNLQKAYLRIESQYFKEALDGGKEQGKKLLEIEAIFKDQDFERILSCLYGMKHEVPRNQAVKYWAISKFLKIDVLAKKLRDSIIDNIEMYQIFELLRLAHDQGQDQIFDRCLKILEQSGYTKLRQCREEFLSLPPELFKIVLKGNNKAKLKGGISLGNLEVHELIKAYCQEKPNQQELYITLKHDLLNAQNLSSNEYKIIYYDEISQIPLNPRIVKTSASFANFHDQSIMKNNSLSQTTNQFVISSENTLYRKRISELNDENEMFKRQVFEIKSQLFENVNAKVEFDKAIEQLRKSEVQHQEKTKTFEQRLKALEESMNMKDQVIKKQQMAIFEMKTELQNLKNMQNQSINFSTSKAKEEKQQEDIFVQSKILPGDYFKDILKPQQTVIKNIEPKMLKQFPQKTAPTKTPQKQKNGRKQSHIQEQIDEDLPQQIEGHSIHEELEFSEQPKTLSRDLFGNLLSILEIDSFRKIKLQLVFRAKKNIQNLSSFLKVAKNIENLIFLIHIWESDRTIGAYLSSSFSGQGLISDSDSFIFNVKQSKKFKIIKPKTIEVGNGALIKFSRDLIIRDECLDELSQCNWPVSYEGNPSVTKDPAVWLTGGKEFQVTELQVYQLVEDEIEMKL